MSAKIYRFFLSLLLLFVAAKVVSFVSPERITLAREEKQVLKNTDVSSTTVYSDDEPKATEAPEDKSEYSEYSEKSEDEAVEEEVIDSSDVVEDSNSEVVSLENSQQDVVVYEDETNTNNKTVTETELNTLQPMTMNISSETIRYENGGMALGQSIIDNDHNVASTWGGAGFYSGSDGLSTHFIAHNPGIFSVLFSVDYGSEIVVVDANSNSRTYVVSLICSVDDAGYDVRTNEDRWDLITGAGNGEAICLQTCIDDYTNLIVFAIAK